MADGINIVHVAHSIAEFIKEERIQDSAIIKELQTKISRGINPSPQKQRPVIASEEVDPRVEDLSHQLIECRKQIHCLEVENDRLTMTMREMVESYSNQLELRDETIRRLE